MVEDGKTILLVEDEPAQREVLAYNLQAAGFDVLTAKSGDEAQIMLSEALPDLVVPGRPAVPPAPQCWVPSQT